MSSSADSSVLSVLDTIRSSYPNVPFLALGQTVLWDEPVKAVWRRLLDTYFPEAVLIAGVHDTDYFAKTTAHLGDDKRYVALHHNDGATRDLWSAAGEMSSLFGSESIPTRQMYESHGIPFDWLAKTYPGGKAQLFADKTEAWGWQGIVSTDSRAVIAHDVPILDIKDALLAQLDWAFSSSLTCLAESAARDQARIVAETIRGWIVQFLHHCCHNCRLSDLYQELTPRIYNLLLGCPPTHFRSTASTEIFQFNSNTALLPRFQIVQAFLNPQTREAASRAYNRAVAGSGIYGLDAFGEGAIPFDVVVPERGRGTIRIVNEGLVIETAPSATMVNCKPIRDILSLASAIEEQFGDHAALVGKAVALPDMIAKEFLVLFHETASAYTSVTQDFNNGLKSAGIEQNLYPIVRLTYNTWDALADISSAATFSLPSHLAKSFGCETVSANEFGRRWRNVVAEQELTLSKQGPERSIRGLLRQLGHHDPVQWEQPARLYEEAIAVLKGIASKSQTLRDRVEEHKEQLRIWQREREELEIRKGEDWRKSILPLMRRISSAELNNEPASSLKQSLAHQLEIRYRAFDSNLQTFSERITATHRMVMEFRKERRKLERGHDATTARTTISDISRSVHMARLDSAHDAYLTVAGLTHTNLRPTAWWLPLVDPSGEWFSAIVAGTKARLESLE